MKGNSHMSFQLQCIGGDADRISVSSDRNPSWVPVRRKFRCLPARRYEVSLTRDEVVILKSRGSAEIRIRAERSTHGALIVRSSRRGTHVMHAGDARVLELDDGEVVCLRTEQARDPMRGHSIGASPYA
jgi:hypothetical protein